MAESIPQATLDTLRGFAKAGLLPAADVATIARALAAGASDPGPVLVTPKEAARRLGCCTKTVHRLAAEGRLRRVHLRPGVRKTLRYPLADVAAVATLDAPAAMEA